MAFSVVLAIFCFSEISRDKTLLEDRISMAVSSSKILPCNHIYDSILDKMFILYGQVRPCSMCTLMQSDQGLHCPFAQSTDIVEYTGTHNLFFTLLMGFKAKSMLYPNKSV